MNENEISKVIVDSAIEVQRELGGPGLIESVYLRLTKLKLGLVINSENVMSKMEFIASSMACKNSAPLAPLRLCVKPLR